MDLLNLTPHAVVLRREDGSEVTLPPSGTVARVTTREVVVGEVDGVTVISQEFGEVTGLPEEGVPCVVSALVRTAVPGRRGVYSPDTGPSAVRNEQGQVVAVTRLVAA